MGNTNNQQSEPQQIKPPTSFFARIHNPFYRPETINEQTAKILDNYIFKTSYDDPYYKHCTVLQHKQNGELLIYKEIIFQTEQEMNAQAKDWEQRKQKFKHPNVINLRYLIKDSSSGILYDEYKIILLFDYLLVDLNKQINDRIREGSQYSSEQIAKMFTTIIKGYASLQKAGVLNNSVRFSNIYISLQSDGPIIKVRDPKLFDEISNLEAVTNGTSEKDNDVFLSPQEIFHDKCIDKSGVYSLGMSFIQLCLLNYSGQIYDYGMSDPSTKIDFKEIKERLNIIKHKYPVGFYYILKEMLQKNADHRPSFAQLEKKIPNDFYSQISNVSVSLRKTSSMSSSKYLKTDNEFDRRSMRSEVSSKYINDIIPVQNGPEPILSQKYRPQSKIVLTEVNEIYTNGNAYKGQKNQQKQRHGKGKYIYSDGSYYYGDWHRNKMHGIGALYYSDGGVEYEGEWKDDLFEGKGILYGKGSDWLKYEGDFRASKMEGYGILTYNDGSVYTGTFRYDKPHGKGKLVTEDGNVKTGIWEFGKQKQ